MVVLLWFGGGIITMLSICWLDAAACRRFAGTGAFERFEGFSWRDLGYFSWFVVLGSKACEIEDFWHVCGWGVVFGV